jgi:hypothetical protein
MATGFADPLVRRQGAARAGSHCRFASPFSRLTPDPQTDSTALFLKRQCDRTLGAAGDPRRLRARRQLHDGRGAGGRSEGRLVDQHDVSPRRALLGNRYQPCSRTHPNPNRGADDSRGDAPAHLDARRARRRRGDACPPILRWFWNRLQQPPWCSRCRTAALHHRLATLHQTREHMQQLLF